MIMKMLRLSRISTINKFIMRKFLILSVVSFFFAIGCSKEGCEMNPCTPNEVFIGLEGGEFDLKAYSEIAYRSTEVRMVNDQPAVGKYHYYDDDNMPDTSSYPHTINTRWCTIEHRSAKKMTISVFPSEEKQVIIIRIGGIDKRGRIFGAGITGVTIYQGYSSRPKLPDRIYY